MTSRLLSRGERRLVVDALRREANRLREARASYVVQAATGGVTAESIRSRVEPIARDIGILDRLTLELQAHDVRLERLAS